MLLNTPPRPLQFIEFDPQVIAQQLTLLEQTLFKNITPYEFLDLGWQRRDKEQRSPNILAMTKHFNKVIINFSIGGFSEVSF